MHNYKWVDYMAPFLGNRGSQNFSFADGHVALWTWQDQRTLDNALMDRLYFRREPGNEDRERMPIPYRQWPTGGYVLFCPVHYDGSFGSLTGRQPQGKTGRPSSLQETQE